MYTFRRIEAENFMAFKSLDLDLTAYKGITLIAGERAGAGRSNGAAKSTIFEAIYWALWGSLIRKAKKADKVMHRFMRPEERTVVRLTLDVDGREVIIERGRSKSGPSLRILETGATSKDSTTEGVTARIQKLLGKDSRSFLMTDMFAGSVAQFCQMTDAERKAHLEAMTGADRYHAAGKLADERLKATNDKVSRLGSQITQIGLRIDQSLEEKQREIYRCVKASLLRVQEIKDLRKDALTASEKANASTAKLAEFHVLNITKKSEFEKRKSDLQQIVHDAEAAEATLRDQVSKLETENSVRRAEVRRVSDEIDRLKRDEHPDLCSKCGQAWPSNGTSKDHLDAEIERLNAQLKRARADAAPNDAKLVHLKSQVDEQVLKRRKATATIQAMEDERDNRQERTLLSQAILDEGNLASVQKTLVKALQSMPEEGELEVDTSEIDRITDGLKTQLASLTDELAESKIITGRLEFWKAGFGRGGLPSMLLDSSVPNMNATVARVASRLSEGELRVSFDPAAAKGKGDVFAVNVEYADGGDDYEMSSHGEHLRVDLSVLFALRDLIEKRGANRCTQLFLDEITDGADVAFCDAMLGMLREEYPGKDVFLISHEDSLKSQCANTITVRKTGKVSHIV